MKILVLVVCCEDNIGEYKKLSNTIKKTWGTTGTEDAKIYYLWCNNYKAVDSNDYVLNKPESYGMLLWKTLGFLFKHRHDEFDYIVRVNVGAYINIERVINYLQDKPREKFYCGMVGNFEDIVFVSGSCFILSRDLVMLSLRNIKQFGFDHIDDVSFGRFMSRFGIEATICETKLRNVYQDEWDENSYHLKLRSPDGQRETDCQRMIQLFNEHKK